MTDSPTASLAPGAVLHGTYVLDSTLGRGGMGSVWRARHLRLPRPVAIKVLHDQAYESEELLRRFRREAEITSQLGHPHIVEVFDFNVLDDGRAYLVMELLEGLSLRDRIRTQPPLALNEILVLIDQVAGALAHAHRAGVIHRDLKPENVFLVRPDEGRIHAKVLDFGISKIQGAQTVLTQGPSLMGTPRYMSPEQAHGEQNVDHRTDQFALGAIAYELLSGRPAFGGETVTQVLLQVIQEDPVPLERLIGGIPRELARGVDRALSKDREARFEDLDAFRTSIGSFRAPSQTGNVPSAAPDALGSRVPSASPRPLTPPLTPVPAAYPSALNRAQTDPDPNENTFRPPTSVPNPGGGQEGPPPQRAGWFAPLAVVLLAGGLAFGLSVALGRIDPFKTSVRTVALDAGEASASAKDAAMEPAGPKGPMPGLEPRDAEGGVLAGGGAERAAPVEKGGSGPDGRAPENRRTSRSSGRKRPRPPLLTKAQAALKSRRFDEAIRLGRQSLRAEADDRAYAVIAVAHCGKRDLGGARAMLRSTPRSQRRLVLRRCRNLGLDIAL